VPGNSLFSGSFLIGVEASIFLLTVRRMETRAADFLFAAFLFCVAASFALNGPNPDPKENALLMLSLAAYPACRFIGPTIARGLQPAFVATSGIIACIGVLATAYALYDQWPAPSGKPAVLGSYAGATTFVVALGFVILALATRPLRLKWSAMISALLFVPVLIFAAALVRFAFVAILISLLLAALLSAGRQRIYISIVAATIVAGVFAGTLVRFDKIPILITYMIEQNQAAPIVKMNQQALSRAAEEIRTAPQALGTATVPTATAVPTAIPTATAVPTAVPTATAAPTAATITPPSCSLDVNMYNSIAERKALWQDAAYLIPYAGVFGFGLDGFMKYSCVRGFPVQTPSWRRSSNSGGWVAPHFWR
jgi:hypothetical protein